MQYDDGRGLPTDFPTEPNVHFYLSHWGLPALALLLFLAVLIAAVFMAYRYGYSTVGREKALNERLDRVKAALKETPNDTPQGVDGKASSALRAIEENFGRTLALAKTVQGARGGLTKALTGIDEEDAKSSIAPVQSVAAGATVINIAVNQNTVTTADPAMMAGPYANVASTPVPIDTKPVKEKMSAPEREQAIWRALQGLMFFWKSPGARAALVNAQQQVVSSPRWTPPPPPDAAARPQRGLH